MIQPAPTTRIDPAIARGVLAEVGPKAAGTPSYIVIEFANTNYRVHLRPEAPISTEPGKRILGVIRASARRMDKVDSGGRYVEPVYGPPRRVQGAVVAVTPDAVVVDAGFPIHCHPTDSRQKPSDFAPGDFLSFDVLPGATFSST